MRALASKRAFWDIYFGAILLFGGIAGIWLGGRLADRFGTARLGVIAGPAIQW